jgi:hypothetical protein
MPDVLAPEIFEAADRAIARLQPALQVVADALQALPSDQWAALCQLERIEAYAMAQYLEVAPPDDPLPPPMVVIGRQVIELALGAETEGSA